MDYVRRHRWYAGLAIGLVLGLIAGGLWPDAPLHATCTDRVDNFAIATGFVDDDIEAVFVEFGKQRIFPAAPSPSILPPPTPPAAT